MIRTSIVMLFAIIAIGSSRAGEGGRLPLPESLVELDSLDKVGRKWLFESEHQEAFWSTADHRRPQSNLSTCGPTTALIALNSMQQDLPNAKEYGPHPYFTEDNFFTPEVEAIKTRKAVNGSGVTLDQLAKMLRTHGVDAAATHARDTTLEKFREDLRQTLSAKKQYVLSNYFRPALGQEKAGHISLVAAYHESEDRCLVLDCASFKYPSVWVKTADLFKAMGVQDDESRTSRGYILLKAKKSDSVGSSERVDR